MRTREENEMKEKFFLQGVADITHIVIFNQYR